MHYRGVMHKCKSWVNNLNEPMGVQDWLKLTNHSSWNGQFKGPKTRMLGEYQYMNNWCVCSDTKKKHPILLFNVNAWTKRMDNGCWYWLITVETNTIFEKQEGIRYSINKTKVWNYKITCIERTKTILEDFAIKYLASMMPKVSLSQGYASRRLLWPCLASFFAVKSFTIWTQRCMETHSYPQLFK